MKPKVSVLMPVYNGERYLRAAVDSILAQTLGDFELLIVDDGSTDASVDILHSYQDARIRIVHNETNLGITAALNRGLAEVTGDYVARMDCDDMALPHRLEKQWRLLQDHPDIGLCGTRHGYIGGGKAPIPAETEDAHLRMALVFENPFCHGTVMFRRELVAEQGLRYDPDYRHAEDYEFWIRCARHARLANLPETLVLYRRHEGSVSALFREQQRATASRIREQQLDSLGLRPNARQLEIHHRLMHWDYEGDMADLELAKEWLERLAAALQQAFGLPAEPVCRRLAWYWYRACGGSARSGLPVWQMFRASPLARTLGLRHQLKLLLRCLLRRVASN